MYIIANTDLEIKVNVGMSIDAMTRRACLNLIAMNARQEGVKGMVVRFDDIDGYAITPLLTDEDVDKAMFAKFHKEGENDG